MAKPTLCFLGWDRPLLSGVVEHLTGSWAGGLLDLSRLLVIVPTRQAARRLREALALHAAEKRAGVLPPITLTPDSFLRACVPSNFRMASELQSLVAWAQALISSDLEELPAAFPVAPNEMSWAWALPVAESLLEARRILGENGLSFADAARKLIDGEGERWEQLALLEDRCLARLSEASLVDAGAAKAASARQPAWPFEVGRFVIAGVPDPVPLAWEALKNAAAQAALPVDILIQAPQDRAASFDEWGRPDESHWTTCEIPIPNFATNVHIAASPASQAEVAARLVCESLARGETPALGVADAELVPWIEERLKKIARIATYDPRGHSCTTHPLAHLLRLLEELVRERSFAAFAALLRQPTVLDALGGWHKWLAMADETAVRHLPGTIEDAAGFLSDSRRSSESAAGSSPSLRDAAKTVSGLLDKLEAGPFAPALLEVLGQLHGAKIWDPQQAGDALWIEMAQLVSQTATEIDDALQGAKPPVGTADRLGLVLRLIDGERLDAERPEAALDVSGWLELPWEEAAELIVAGFNEGRVPDGISEHAFLPDHVRGQLGLRTNKTRLARDSYLFSTLLGCRRPGAVRLLLGKTGAAQEPLRPSRVLFRSGDDEMVSRAGMLFGNGAESATRAPAWERAWRLQIPRIPALRLEQLRVTQFKDYLHCPFRFYLRHVLGMQSVPAAPLEMDALSFGTLVHEALAVLGHRREMRDCDDEREVAECLETALNAVIQSRFGTHLPVPVHAQVEAALARLTAAARVHAATVREGWRIIEVEYDFGINTPFEIAGTRITGRVDRIERNVKTGVIRVLDYKTSQNAKAPEATHLTGPKSGHLCNGWESWRIHSEGRSQPRGWLDLQLPLYALALRPHFGENILCGYFLLPAAATETDIIMFDLEDGALGCAHRCATGVIRAIQAGRFWPPAKLKPDQPDDFAGLFFGDVEGSLDEVTLASFERANLPA
ncbi:MAG: PD-(D/E)XK nuclease family protein [Verrucomicrobiales bacterium]